MSDPTKDGFTLSEMRTWLGPARSQIRFAMLTARPTTSGPDFHFSQVHACSDLDAERRRLVDDLQGGSNSAGVAVEGRQDAVADGRHLVSSVTSQSRSRHCVMLVDDTGPLAVPQSSGLLGRGDDVGEKKRGRHEVAFGTPTSAGQELCDLVHEGVRVPDVEDLIVAGQFDKPCPRDVLCKVSTGLHSDHSPVPSMQHQGRCLDPWEQGPDVLGAHTAKPPCAKLSRTIRVDAQTLASRVPCPEGGVVCLARRKRFQP